MTNDLGFGLLEVKLYHSPNDLSNLRSLNSIIDSGVLDYVTSVDKHGAADTFIENYTFEFSFTNEQLACDFEIVDSLESSADVCKLTVWNVQENSIVTVNDVFIFKYYWEHNPKKYSIYTVRVQEIETTMDNADIKTTINGTMMDENLIYNASVHNLYPKISNYKQLKDILENIYRLNFLSNEKAFDDEVQLLEPLFTKEKSIGEILDNVCDQREWKWKISKDSVAIYDPEKEDTNGVFKIPVLIINYNDIYKYSEKSDGIEIETDGIPDIVAGQVIYLDTSDTPDFVETESKYYIIDEIKTTIKRQNGFFSNLFMHEVVNDE